MPVRSNCLSIVAVMLSAGSVLLAPGASAAEKVIMATTGVASAQQWPIWIANSKGFLAENGVDVEFVGASSAAAVIQQVAAGSANVGTGGLSDPLRAIDRGARVSLLRIEAQVPPYSIWGKRTIASLKDLKGKIVMLGGIKDITRVYFERMMEPNGLKWGEYDTVFAGTAASRFAALNSGAIDATILNPPFSFKAEPAGFNKLGQVTDYVKDLPFTGIAVNLDWGLAHKSAVAGYLQGVAAGVDWFYDDKNRDEAIDILQKLSKAERSDIAQAYDYYKQLKIFDHKGLIAASTLGNLAKALKDIGDLEGSTDVARFQHPEMAALAAAVK